MELVNPVILPTAFRIIVHQLKTWFWWYGWEFQWTISDVVLWFFCFGSWYVADLSAFNFNWIQHTKHSYSKNMNSILCGVEYGYTEWLWVFMVDLWSTAKGIRPKRRSWLASRSKMCSVFNSVGVWTVITDMLLHCK